MKAWVCKQWGPPETLTFEDVTLPAPTGTGVHIRIHSASVNFPDVLIIEGKYQIKPPFPFTPGVEGAGVVTAVGPDVKSLKVGDRVLAASIGINNSRASGAFAEEMLTDELTTFKMPDSMSFDDGASFMTTYGTSHHALFHRGHLKHGETLLVLGAGGGVGLTAVELGKLVGAKIIAAAGSDEKLAVAQRYGADHLINYSRESIKDRVKAITGDRGADVIYDPVGGDAFDQAMRCVAWEGRILIIGFASGRIAQAATNLLLLKEASAVGVVWGPLTSRDPRRYRAGVEDLIKQYAAGKLKPYISHRFPLAEAPKAMQAMLERKQTGKIVVKIRD
jgi:NADPH2:quinone reductase